MREIDYSSFENSKLKLNSSNEVLDMLFSVIRWPHRKRQAGAKQTDKQTKVHKNQVIAVVMYACMVISFV